MSHVGHGCHEAMASGYTPPDAYLEPIINHMYQVGWSSYEKQKKSTSLA